MTQKVLKGHTSFVFCVNYNNASNLLVSGGCDGEIRIWNVEKGMLKIPEVHLVVFATGDDPLAASDAEARCDAVLLIRMSDVCLETAGSLIVP